MIWRSSLFTLLLLTSLSASAWAQDQPPGMDAGVVSGSMDGGVPTAVEVVARQEVPAAILFPVHGNN